MDFINDVDITKNPICVGGWDFFRDWSGKLILQLVNCPIQA